jgi:hypothetical protein
MNALAGHFDQAMTLAGRPGEQDGWDGHAWRGQNPAGHPRNLADHRPCGRHNILDLYFYAISKAPVGDGSGFQWLAEVPLTMIYLFVTVPASALSFFRKTAQAGGILGTFGLVLFSPLWAQLLEELRL